MGYAKLFSSITESSLWGEPKEVRLLFVTMLARADSTGFVEASVPGLARVANLTLDEVESSLAALEGPDPHSKDLDRAPENEGRRITKVPGGWMVLNYEDYRSRRSDEERRNYMRDYMKEYRKSRKQVVNNGKTPLNAVKRGKPRLAQAETETEATTTLPPASLNEMALSIYSVYPRKVGRAKALTEIKKALSKVEFTELIQKVKLYAGARDGQPIKYTPHPATWFSQERYADDPAGWTESEPEPAGDPQVPDRTNELPDCNDNELALKAMWKTTMEAE